MNDNGKTIRVLKPNSFRCCLGIHKFETTNKLGSIYWVKCERCGLVTTKKIL